MQFRSSSQMNTIAERELEAMFREHDGSFQEICEALLEENAGIEYVNCDNEVKLERMGLTATEMKIARERKPKQRTTLADLISEQAHEIEEDAVLPSVEEAPEDQEEVEEDQEDEERDSEEEQ
jgi:hypothetical protein